MLSLLVVYSFRFFKATTTFINSLIQFFKKKKNVLQPETGFFPVDSAKEMGTNRNVFLQQAISIKALNGAIWNKFFAKLGILCWQNTDSSFKAFLVCEWFLG